MHRHGVHRLALQAVHPHVGHTRFWIFGDHQPKGDDATGIPWPWANQRDRIKVHLIATEHLLTTGRVEISIGFGFHQVPEHPRKLLGFLQAFGGTWLLQQRQSRTQVFELLGAF